MKVAVLNGSPKDMVSVTMQYVRYLQKEFAQHELVIHHVCGDAKKLEKDDDAFRAVIDAIGAADAVLWATPVYVLLVPGPYKRFIELVFERGAQAAFRDKYAAALTTSIRFFDHTAHAYLHAVSEDLGMHFAGAYSAEMYDLLDPAERRRLTLFWEAFLDAAGQRAPIQRRFDPLMDAPPDYQPDAAQAPEPLPTGGRKIVVLSDAEPGGNLQRMVDRLCACFAEPPEVVNLQQIKMVTGCMGCMQCALDNVCAFRDADDVCGVYRKLAGADVVIEAGTVRDRYLSARFKTFWDRGFFNNHVPILVGKQVASLVSGPLAQLPGLRETLETMPELQQANLAGIVTDECGDSREIDALLEQLARRLLRCAEQGYVQPPTFLVKAGRKLLRDEIWASLRFVFHADHRYYKKHGLYDFPRRSLGTRLQEAFYRLLLHLPGFRKEFLRRMRTEMIRPLEKVLEEA